MINNENNFKNSKNIIFFFFFRENVKLFYAGVMWDFRTLFMRALYEMHKMFTCVCVGVNCSALCVFYVRTAAAVHITQWSPDGEYFATAGKVTPPSTHRHTHSILYKRYISIYNISL